MTEPKFYHGGVPILTDGQKSTKLFMGIANQLGGSIQHECCKDYGAKTPNDHPKVLVEKKGYAIDDDLQSDSCEKHSNQGF